MKMKSSESILLLATIKAIIKEIECSRGNENMVWLVGFIIGEVMSYIHYSCNEFNIDWEYPGERC